MFYNKNFETLTGFDKKIFLRFPCEILRSKTLASKFSRSYYNTSKNVCLQEHFYDCFQERRRNTVTLGAPAPSLWTQTPYAYYNSSKNAQAHSICRHFCAEFQESVRIFRIKIRVGRQPRSVQRTLLRLYYIFDTTAINCGRDQSRSAVYLR